MIMAGLTGPSILHLYPVSPSAHFSSHQLAPVLPLGFSSHRIHSFVLTTSSSSSKSKCMCNEKTKWLSRHQMYPLQQKRDFLSIVKLLVSLTAPLVSTCLLSSPATCLTMDVVPSNSFHLLQAFSLANLEPSLASLMIHILGPFFTSLNFLFIIRIVMSWYPQLPVDKFPYVLVFAPTEPVLEPTRKLIPPVGGVDVSPVIWVALMSFLNEILLGQQGLLVLLSQQHT